ncbi:hypothetical protein AWH60_07685 [Pseudoalteromonas haloplanktis]|nr:hypothetical protein AWH60_07685 [Pseudoalteromonas haloplanktis]
MKIYKFIIFIVVGLFASQPKSVFAFYTNLGAIQVSSYAFNESDVFNINHQNGSDFDVMLLNDDNKSELVISNFTSFTVNTKPLTIYVPQSNAIEKLVISSPAISLKNSITILGKAIDIVFVSSNNISCSNCGFKNAGRISLLTGTFLNDIIDVKANSTINVNGLLAAGVQSLEVFSDKINTAGVIDLNLKATVHPAGGYVISDNGNLVAGAGGINLYAGDFKIRYSDLDIQDVNIGSGVYQPKGTLKAASIGIVSSKSIEIPSSTELNTMSDLLATSTRQGSFYAPSEGIFIQVAKNPSASISAKGKLYSDNIITTKSISNQTFHNTSRVMGKAFKALTKGIVSNYGYIEAGVVGINGSKFINSGSIRGAKLDVESAADVYNSFGGEILVGLFTVKIDDGIFVNGSRTNKLYHPDKLALKTPLLDMTSTKHGLYNSYTEPGVVQTNLSANIHANEVRISAKAIENINPYSLKKAITDDWDSSIRVNTQYANQVSMTAETYLGLKANNYVRNASAILGLNQQGNFDVNTSKFYNERYRLEGESFLVSQITLDSIKAGKFDEVNVGTKTRIIAYSPPGRVYSLGKLKVSDGDSVNEDEEFINAFSYVEVFGDSHFHQLELKTVGLELAKNLSKIEILRIRSCIVFGVCPDNKVNITAEAETLFSLQGNIYGLNQLISSESNFEQNNLNFSDQNKKNAVDKYISQYTYFISENKYGELLSVDQKGDLLTGTYKVCDGQRAINYMNLVVPNCSHKSFSQSIPVLLEEFLKNNKVGNTGYTYAEISRAANKFVQGLPKKSIPGDKVNDNLVIVTNKVYSSFALSPDDKVLTVSYYQKGIILPSHPGVQGQQYSFQTISTAPFSTVMACLPDSACTN